MSICDEIFVNDSVEAVKQNILKVNFSRIDELEADLELKYMDEIFLTMEDFNPSNYKELAVDNKENAEDTYPCPVCKKEILGTEPYCKDCEKKMERALTA